MLRLAASRRGGQTKCCAWQHQGRGGPRNALGYRPEPEVLPLPAETSREAPKCGPETRSGTVQSLKCCPCQQKRAARLPVLRLAASRGGGPRNALGYRPEPEVLPLPAETSREAPKCCAWQHQGRGPRNALGHRPEPEVLPLPAETSREAPKCCAWQHQGGGGPETRSGTVQSQQKRAARLPSAAPGSIKGGGFETRSGTVQSLKSCPCQQKRAARLPSAAPGSIKGGGPRNALGHRPEPEVLPLPAETSREAPKCVSSVKRARAP